MPDIIAQPPESTISVLSKLGCPDGLSKPIQPNPIKVLGSDALRQKIAKFSKKEDFKDFVIPEDGSLPISDFNQRFDTIEKLRKTPLNNEDVLFLEEYRAALMASFHLHLLVIQAQAEFEEDIKKLSRAIIAKKIFYYFILAVGITNDAAGSFVGLLSMFALIQGFPHPAMLACAGVLTVLNAFLFVAFEASLLRSALKLEAIDNHTKEIIITINRQIDLIKDINEDIFNYQFLNKVDAKTLKPLNQFALKLNQYAEDQKKNFEHYQESTGKKVARWGITIFGAGMTAAGTYFLAVSLLTVLAAGLVGTPIGWAIIGLLIIASIVFYFAMEGKGVFNLLNPAANEFKTAKKKLNHLPLKKDNDFKQSLTHKQELEDSAIKRTERPLSLSLTRSCSCPDFKPMTPPAIEECQLSPKPKG